MVTSISMLILTYLLLTNFLASLIIFISHNTSTFQLTMMVTPLICSSHDPVLLLSHTFLTMNPTSPITNLSHSNFSHTSALQPNDQPSNTAPTTPLMLKISKVTSSLPLSTHNPASNASDLADQFSSTLKSILDIHTPIRSKTVVQRPHTPWINPEILQAKRERSRLERCWRRWKSPFDRMKFRAQCNSVRSLISKAKSSFLSNLLTESSDNPRTLWKTLYTILHRKSSNSLPESPDASSLANTFLDFFKDKIERIRTKFVPSDSPDPFLSPPAPTSKNDQFYSSHSH